jgi:hypothetical protein
MGKKLSALSKQGFLVYPKVSKDGKRRLFLAKKGKTDKLKSPVE